MKNLTLQNIAGCVSGRYIGDRALLLKEISAVTTDSREVRSGCLFAAIKGERSDGNDYILKAAELGALCAIGQRVPEDCPIPVILVEDTVSALGDLAGFYRSGLDVKILGVTGSVGKTTAKEMLYSVLSQRFKVHKTAKNLNNELGVPLTLFGLDESFELAVVEMGISHFGEMTRLAEIARPDMALYTTIGAAHLEFLGDFEGVLRAKSELLPLLPEDGTVFVNGDDETLKNLTCSQSLCRYGISADCEVRGENVRVLGEDGMTLDIASGERCFSVEIHSFGVHMVTAALGAAAVGIRMGLTDAEIAAGIAAYRPVGSRSGLIKTPKLTIIDDCYNANPTSTAAALKSLSLLKQRKVAILGDMGELGESAGELHRQTGERAGEAGLDLLIACGRLSAHTAEGARAAGVSSVKYFPDKAELLKGLGELLSEGDAVLVKASHAEAFEEIVDALKGI